MPAAIPIALGISAVAGVASAAIGSDASKTAAQQQADSATQALDFQKQVFNTDQQNQAPYLQAGTTSLAQLMSGIESGQYGPGSLPAVPNAPGAFTGQFNLPTLEEAQQTPGYQFVQGQGNKGILQGAAAAGGAISGGTLKALSQYDTNLANTTYQSDVANQQAVYQAGLQGYQANLAGYGAQLAQSQQAQSQQQQGFAQLLAPAQLGEGAVQNIDQTGAQTAQNVASLEGQIGNAQAAGTVGSANAINSGISGFTGAASQALTLSQLLPLILKGNNSGISSPGYISGGLPSGSLASLGLAPA